MSDYDDYDDLDPAEAMAALRDQIRTQGARAAYEALLAVCGDPKAPAPARATAGTTLMRAAGLLEKREEKPEDPLAALNSNDIRKVIANLESTLAEAAPKPKARTKAKTKPAKKASGLFE